MSDFTVPDSSASGSRGRAHPCRIPWRPGHRPGRTARWWHCCGSVCHLPSRNKDNIQQVPPMEHDVSLLWHTPCVSGVKPADITNHKLNPKHSNVSGWKLQLVWSFSGHPLVLRHLKMSLLKKCIRLREKQQQQADFGQDSSESSA